MKGKREVAIVHYNTPELTYAAILSLRKHGGGEYHVTVFDNSDARPFVKKIAGVTRIDNTRGKYVDFDAELRKYPDKDFRMGCGNGCAFGSAKHLMSVQKLWELLPDGFLLMDSDVLIRRNVDFMFNDDLCAVGHIQTWQQAGNRGEVDRLVPMLLWINVPKCVAGGARFFDPARAFALNAGGARNRNNWYDTGASFLEDIQTLKPQCQGLAIDIRPLMAHYVGGSWKRNVLSEQLAWLRTRHELWNTGAMPEFGGDAPRVENKNAKIYVLAHNDFQLKVKHPVYEVVDARDGGDMYDGLTGAFYSELLQLHRIAGRKRLPNIVGSCGYRKYFSFGSYAPALSWYVKQFGAIVSLYTDLGLPMWEHYGRYVGNIEDLDIVTGILKKDYAAFMPAWKAALKNRLMHPASMFVMGNRDFREMEAMVWDVVQKYLQAIGGAIYARVQGNPDAYHLENSTLGYQIRVGGQLCERLISAWIDWKCPEAKQWPVITFDR